MKFNNEILGAMCLVAAGFFLSFGGLFIRLVEDASTMQITSYRAVTFSLIALIYILFKFKKKTPQAFKSVGSKGILIAFINRRNN